MSCMRVSARMIAFALALFLGIIAFQSTSVAQNRGLDPAKISEFQSKLEIARRTQADLNRRVICLNQRDDRLVSQRNQQELRLGELRTQERQLNQASREQQAAYEGYISNYQREQNNLHELRRQLQALQARKRAQERDLQDCKSKPYIPNFMCDAAYGILELVGEMKNYDGEIAAAARREQIARESASFAQGKLEQSRHDLESTRGKVNAVTAEISRTESEISALKTALADIRAQVQPYQILIDELLNTLTEAKDVNLEDARARTERKLSTIAANIDAAMGRSAAAVQHANSILPRGWMETCVAR